jgi:3',5'-cyclic AMP phosphodiesterase CpdA
MSGEVMRIAHVSDVHVMATGALRWRDLVGKRVTGWANLHWRRGKAHDNAVARAVLADLREQPIDHVVVTGDWVNLSLEQEFAAALRMFEDVLGTPPDRVTMVPGNHDAYTRGAERSRRFARHFGAYLRTDLPELSTEHPSGRFPIVKLRGPVAFIGLSNAVARPPLVASGWVGKAQLSALARVLAHDEVRSRFPVIAVHHPVHRLDTVVKQATNGLEDQRELWDCLDVLERGLVLHGHLHRRMRRAVTTRNGVIEVLGATSASLLDPAPARRAGYNVYEIEDGRLSLVTTRVYDPPSGTLASQPFADASLCP